MHFSVKYWMRLSIISLLVVATVGVLMRYKIPFSLPQFNQKHLLHAHSHFAFVGWITQTLYVLLIHFLLRYKHTHTAGKYRFILAGNLICAYGMLLSFIVQGYGSVSITFSTLSIFINYIFCFWLYKDLGKISMHDAKKWLRASLLFSILSSLGTFYMAYMMYTKSVNQDHYLGSLYFFLHFQYNGWFLFAGMGLLIVWLTEKIPHFKMNPIVFHLFFWTCIPAYFLSVLWAALPVWLYQLTVVAAMVQLAAWWLLARQLKNYRTFLIDIHNKTAGVMLLLAAAAFSIKLLLQLGSTIPMVSKLAFGFRPIVIAYLHLILLAVFTLYLLGYSYANGVLRNNKFTRAGLIIIVIGIILNEFVLLVQGVAAFSYTPVAFVNEILLAVSAIIFVGIAVLLISQFAKDSKAVTSQIR